MRYGSVCSGVEAATVAWHPLGWVPVFFSEIDSAASRVLHHHYGCGRPQFMPRSDAPEIDAAERHRRWAAIKAVHRLIPPHAGGLPNLGDMTQFREWPDHAIDLLVGGTPCQSFSVAGLREGLADPRGNLALVYLAIADRYRPKWLVWENVPGVLSSEGGRDFGAILGAMGQLGYGWAYRVLDAQYVRVDGFGRAVPQRRRRVVVVGCLGDWRGAAAVLFERESLCGRSPPRRDAGKGFARGVEFGPSGGGYTDVNPTLDCRAKDGPIRNQLAGAVMTNVVANTLTRRMHKGVNSTLDEGQTLVASGVAHALRAEGFDASEDGTGRGVPLVPVAYRTTCNDGCYETGDVVHALTTATDPNSHVLAIQERAISENPESGPDGAGVRADGAAYTLESHSTTQGVAFDMRGREGGASRSFVAGSWAVRRLTPVECERLQGFPDNYTLLQGAAKPQADGPRYKQMGNSMAVNFMRWVGKRIQMVEDAAAEAKRVSA